VYFVFLTSYINVLLLLLSVGDVNLLCYIIKSYSGPQGQSLLKIFRSLYFIEASPGSMTQATHEPTRIREAKQEDASAIARLGAKVFSTTFGHSMPASDLEAYLAESYSPSAILADLANSNKDTVLVCPSTNPNHVLGFATLIRRTIEPCIRHLEGTTVELQRLYIEPDSHGRGLGRALVMHVETIARHEGFATMWLGVWEENVKAQQVYGRLGYEKVGDRDFVMGSCRQTDWIMLKSLE